MKPVASVITLLCVGAAGTLGVLIIVQAGPLASQQAPNLLPGDVYPDSRNRLPLVQREDLDEQTRSIYDGIVSNPRLLAGLQGPSGIRLHSPRLATGGGLGYLRWETDLGRRLTELAILVTARELDQQFEWTAHEPAAIKEGLEAEIIDIVRYRRPMEGLGEKESAIIQLGREALGQRRVSSATFANALAIFGAKTLVDLASLMGQYAATAVVLDTLDQQLPPGQEPLLPIP